MHHNWFDIPLFDIHMGVHLKNIVKITCYAIHFLHSCYLFTTLPCFEGTTKIVKKMDAII